LISDATLDASMGQLHLMASWWIHSVWRVSYQTAGTIIWRFSYPFRWLGSHWFHLYVRTCTLQNSSTPCI